jgi:very-short-patch-repair endonuclease
LLVHMSGSDRKCEEIARGNHGIITFEEARDAGLSEKGIDYRVEHRGWCEVHPNVFRMPGVPDSLGSRRAAAVKAAGDGAMLSHRTAGAMLELEGIEAADEIEVVAYSGITLQGVKVHRIGKGDIPKKVFVNGLPVTRVERVLIDLAGCLPIPVVGIAIDHALRKKLTTLARLWAELGAVGGRGRRGTKAFRIMLSARDEMTAQMRSTFEAKMRRILKRIKGHTAVPNYKVITPNGPRYFDFCYPGLKLAIECHSIDWHTGERMKRDLKRHRELEAMGYKILYFTWDEVCFEADMVEREVRKAIEERQLFLPAEA